MSTNDETSAGYKFHREAVEARWSDMETSLMKENGFFLPDHKYSATVDALLRIAVSFREFSFFYYSTFTQVLD